MAYPVPDFDDLPKVDGMPKGCAWGLFDRNGEKDQLGTLNFLTPEVVKAAAQEVRDGVSISLNWPINAMARFALPGRKQPEHNIINLGEANEITASTNTTIGKAWDDEISFNTQCSSQWDSLIHFQHQPSGLAYNGANPDHATLSAIQSTAGNTMPTLDHWHARGCVVARGVLLDYQAYAEAKGIPYDPFSETRIKVDDLESCAAHQGVEFRHGDILLVRTGATEALDGFTMADLGRLAAAQLAGVDGSEESARWIWNKRFAAVASDNHAFEAYPPLKPDGQPGTPSDLVLHSYLLSLFGMSIGELWDLSKLSAYCQKTKRYSFMLTSAPLNHPGLIGSPPNALAIF